MGVDTSKDRKWGESFSIKFLNGIVLFVHRSTVLFLTSPLIGVLGLVCIPDIIALLLANIQLYFQYRTNARKGFERSLKNKHNKKMNSKEWVIEV